MIVDNGEYNDDYDDSFDEVPSFSVQDGSRGDAAESLEQIRAKVILENQALKLEQEMEFIPGQMPRSLQASQGAEGQPEEEMEESSSAPNGGGAKGRGRGKGSGEGKYGAGRGQVVANQRKDRNKAKVGNHNRKKGAAKKAAM